MKKINRVVILQLSIMIATLFAAMTSTTMANAGQGSFALNAQHYDTAITRNNRWLFVAGLNSLDIIDTSEPGTPQSITTYFSDYPIIALALNNDDSYLYVLRGDGYMAAIKPAELIEATYSKDMLLDDFDWIRVIDTAENGFPYGLTTGYISEESDPGAQYVFIGLPDINEVWVFYQDDILAGMDDPVALQKLAVEGAPLDLCYSADSPSEGVLLVSVDDDAANQQLIQMFGLRNPSELFYDYGVLNTTDAKNSNFLESLAACQEYKSNRANTPPVNNAPLTASGNELTQITFNINPTDIDTSEQTLTCSIVRNDCQGGSLSGCVFRWTPTEAEGPNDGCDVVTKVYDELAYSNEKTTTITVKEVNAAPVISTTAPKYARKKMEYSYDSNVTDPDGPSSTWTVDAAADTCDGDISSSAGVYTFTPTGTAENCVLSIKVSDGFTPIPGADTETKTISIKPYLDAPDFSLALGNQSITVTLQTLNDDYVDSYFIYYSDSEDDLADPDDMAAAHTVRIDKGTFTPGKETKVIIDNLTNDTRYYVRVQAFDPYYLDEGVSSIKSVVAQKTSSYTESKNDSGSCRVMAASNSGNEGLIDTAFLFALWTAGLVFIRRRILKSRSFE